MINNLILGCLWPLIFVLNNILTLGIWRSAISHLPGCFCPWTFFQNIGFNMMPYRTPLCHIQLLNWDVLQGSFRLCNWLSLACSVWCRGLTTCLQYVCPLFWKSTFKQQLGCRFDLMDCKSSFFYFDICNCICLNTSYDFSALSLLLK